MKKELFSFLDSATRPFRGTGLKKIPGVMPLYSFVFKKLRPEYALVGGFKIFLDPLDSLELATKGNRFEYFSREVFRQMIKKDDTIVDLGAHIGLYTLLAAKTVGENGKIFSFEASPTTSAILTKNVQVNGFADIVTVIPKAISNQSGKSSFYLFERYGSMGNSMYEDPSNKKIEVETISLDDFFRDHPTSHVDAIKMDIEGAEWNALQGMRRTLVANPNIKILTEFYPRLIKASGVDPLEYLKAFDELGFGIYVINEPLKMVTLSKPEEIARLYTVENDSLANLVCSRQPFQFHLE